MKIYVVDEAQTHDRYCTTLQQAKKVAQATADHTGMTATIILCTVAPGRAKDVAVLLLSGQGWSVNDETVATVKPRKRKGDVRQ